MVVEMDIEMKIRKIVLAVALLTLLTPTLASTRETAPVALNEQFQYRWQLRNFMGNLAGLFHPAEELERWERHLGDLAAQRPFRDVLCRLDEAPNHDRTLRIAGKPIVDVSDPAVGTVVRHHLGDRLVDVRQELTMVTPVELTESGDPMPVGAKRPQPVADRDRSDAVTEHDEWSGWDEGAADDRVGRKRDRLARLLRVASILYSKGGTEAGVPVDEIARLTGMTTRTVYRDIRALEDELDVVDVVDGHTGDVARRRPVPPAVRPESFDDRPTA